MHRVDTDVAIVGAGPAGLMLAIELGCRNIACTLIDKEENPPTHPKANASSARTMEHYRRRGLAQRVRAIGLPDDHPQDIVYFTRLLGLELSRFRGPSSAQARTRSFMGDLDTSRWPSAELPHRGQQMFIEKILRDELARYPSITTRFGWTAQSLQNDVGGVALTIQNPKTQASWSLNAQYAVGCDGARSMVREAMQIGYLGMGGEQRDFFGGQMAGIYLQSAELATLLPDEKAWQYWFVNSEKRGVLVAMDGVDKFCFAVQLAAGQTIEALDVAKTLATLVGRSFGYTLLSLSAWTAGHTLVAQQFRVGRCFIAGDAAHLFTPTAGMGYNTSVDDAVNLGWKLASVIQGWGGTGLLDSYEPERQPIARRNTAYARSMADSMAALAPPSGIEDPHPANDPARSAYGERCRAHLAREYNIPGLQLGMRYESAVVATETTPPPPDEATHYIPSGYPGARAPHMAMDGATTDAALFDQFGLDFTLLQLGGPEEATPWTAAAAALNIPLKVVRCSAPGAHALYGADLALIRPDGHIAWRGNHSADADAALRLATSR